MQDSVKHKVKEYLRSQISQSDIRVNAYALNEQGEKNPTRSSYYFSFELFNFCMSMQSLHLQMPSKADALTLLPCLLRRLSGRYFLSFQADFDSAK